MADVKQYKVFKNKNFEVLTDQGFKDFKGVIKGENSNKIKIKFSNDKELICTPKHKLIKLDFSIVFAKDLKIGDVLYGNIIILNITTYVDQAPVYEFLEVKDTHTYLVNGILSHQCIILDEFAFVRPEIAHEFYEAVYPTISSSRTAKIIMLSCVTPETFIFTESGISEIGELMDMSKEGGYFGKKYSVLGHSKFRESNILYNNGKAATKKITTTNSKLECSDVHKLFTTDGWKMAKDLNVGDYLPLIYNNNVFGSDDTILSSHIVSPKQKNIFNKNIISKEFAYFMGLYIAEGSSYINREGNGASITITCGDDISLELDSLNLNYYKDPDGLHYVISSISLYRAMESLGFDMSRTANNKIIPSRLFKMSKENTIYLLRGIFDGDGFCDSVRGRVGISLSSKRLIEQIRILLQNFGILSLYTEVHDTLGESSKCYSENNKNTIFHSYRLELSLYNSKLFHEIIGFNFERKSKLYSIVKNTSDKSSLDIFPIDKSIIKKFLKRNKIKYIDFKELTGIKDIYSSGRMGRRAWLKIKSNYYGLDSELDSILDLVDEDIKWVEIKKIENGYTDVFDVSLPDDENDFWCHSVLYNGLLGHQTPNGTNGKFYEMYSKAELGEGNKEWNGWKASKIMWDEIPRYNQMGDLDPEGFKTSAIAGLNGDLNSWLQEFCCVFHDSGAVAINLSLLQKLKKEVKKPLYTFDEGDYLVWEEAVPGNIYTIGVDVSEGVGLDYSVAQVLDITDLTNIRLVAQYHSNTIQPYVFAEKLNKVARGFGRPFIAIERNGPGGQVIDALYEIHKYDNIIHYSMKNDKRGMYQKMGIYSHTNSKYTGIMNMKYWLETLQCVSIPDINTLKEYETFRRKENGSWSAKDGHYDDRVMSMVWALIPLETEIAQRYFSILQYDDIGKPKVIKDPNAEFADYLGPLWGDYNDSNSTRSLGDPSFTSFGNSYQIDLYPKQTEVIDIGVSNWTIL